MLHLASGLPCSSQHHEMTPESTLWKLIHQLQAHFWWSHNFTVACETLALPPQLSPPVHCSRLHWSTILPETRRRGLASSTLRVLLGIPRCRQVDRELPEFLSPSVTLQWRAFTVLMHYLPSTAIGHILISASWFKLAGLKGWFEEFLPKSLHLRLSRTLESSSSSSSSSSLWPPAAPLRRAGVHRSWSKPHANQGWVVTKYV